MATIKELVVKVSEKTGFTKKDTEKVIRTTFDTIFENVIAGDKTNIPGFGAFSCVTRAERKARNPITGESIDVPEKKAIKFKPSKGLKDTLNA